ncbi:MAG: F0F1 ATP synthase subunit delta [Anaerolineae bacterium]|nr:F0F1 ATP synthase subunit delta [Anaerolineae bacterium]
MLDLDAATILFELFNFIVLSILLYYLLFRPVMKKVQERAAEKERIMQEVEQERLEAIRMREELEARLSNLDQEVNAILAQAYKNADLEHADLLQAARAEAERVLVEAHSDAIRLQQQEMDSFYQVLLDAILEISGQLVTRTVPPDLHKALIEQINERIWELGRGEIQRVEAFRRSMGERTPIAYVTTVLPLSPEQQGQLARTFTALADHHVNLELEIDPKLVAGARVRLGDMLVDNSIGGRMAELRESVLQALKERIANA